MQIILSYVQKIPNLPEHYHVLTAQILSALVFFGLLYLLARVFTYVCNNYLSRLVKLLKAERWFKAMSERKFFTALGIVIAAIAAINLHSVFVTENIGWITIVMVKITGMFVLLSFSYLGFTILNTLDQLYGRNPKVPIKGLVQVFKILLFLVTALFLISLLLGRKPLYIITGLSALAAVFSLIFKDPILGFAASIQLTMNNLIKIGDWITVDSAGADGNILDISLTSVRVQNFDMTIVSVPTYDLISKPFKNWSGMYMANARRVQRSMVIDIDSVKFLDKETLERLKKIELLTDYLTNKEKEIADYNQKHDIHENMINGRQLTNLGTFRHYAEEYLKSRSFVTQADPGFTLMVRQLPPNAMGIPLEVYCFLNTTVWTQYEALQADIFDHLFSVLPEFGLYAYQQPSGRNLSKLIK